jgi:hypothetical protein
VDLPIPHQSLLSAIRHGLSTSVLPALEDACIDRTILPY